MNKHLVIKYFDTYPERRYYFDTKQEAEKFAEEKNKTAGYLAKYLYRGEVE